MPAGTVDRLRRELGVDLEVPEAGSVGVLFTMAVVPVLVGSIVATGLAVVGTVRLPDGRAGMLRAASALVLVEGVVVMGVTDDLGWRAVGAAVVALAATTRWHLPRGG